MKVFKSMNFKSVIFINNGLLFHIHISEEVKQSGVMALPEGRNSAEEASSSEPLLRPVAAELSELYRETTLHPGKKKKTWTKIPKSLQLTDVNVQEIMTEQTGWNCSFLFFFSLGWCCFSGILRFVLGWCNVMLIGSTADQCQCVCVCVVVAAAELLYSSTSQCCANNKHSKDSALHQTHDHHMIRQEFQKQGFLWSVCHWERNVFCLSLTNESFSR